jgi:hypothetical protein
MGTCLRPQCGCRVLPAPCVKGHLSSKVRLRLLCQESRGRRFVDVLLGLLFSLPGLCLLLCQYHAAFVVMAL